MHISVCIYVDIVRVSVFSHYTSGIIMLCGDDRFEDCEISRHGGAVI